MGDLVAFKTKDGVAEFHCTMCGEFIVSICHHGPPICALCKHLPGWTQGDDGRLIPPTNHGELL